MEDVHDQHLAVRGDGVDASRGERQPKRLGALRPHGVELGILGAIPGRRIDDRLPVRSKTGGVDGPPSERQPLERRDCRRTPLPDHPAREEPRRQSDSDRRQGRERPGPAANLRGGRLESRHREPGESFESEGDVVRGMEPLLGILLDRVPDDPLEAGRDALVRDGEVRRFFPQDRRHRLGRRVAVERSPAREHLVEDGAEGEDVRPGVGGLALHLLRRHVAERPEHDSRLRAARRRRQSRRLGPRLGVRELGQAEIEDLDAPIVCHEQVLGFQIPMDDPFLVRRGQSVRDLERVVDRLPRRELRSGERRAQRLPFEQLLDDIRSAFVGPDVVNRGDVGMVQDPGGPGLLLEPSQPVRRPPKTTRAAP